MVVRDAQKGDVYIINKLYQEFANETPGYSDAPSLDADKIVVCEVDGKLVGYGTACEIQYCNQSFTQGEHIYVKLSYRNTKAGSLIYRSLRKWARLEGRSIILLSEPDELEMWQRKGYKAIRHIMVKEAKCPKLLKV